MNSLLAFDQAPPLGAPLRFFLTAPLCAAAAGLLLLLQGPAALTSRWTPEALALTHLITAGFMLQIMVGALLQILPVATGAAVARPLAVARLVHGLLSGGLVALVAGFLSYRQGFLLAALGGLGGGVLVFLLALGRALFRHPGNSPIERALKLAVAGLGVTVLLGLSMVMSLAWELSWPLLRMTGLHLAWGLVGWGILLLSGVAYVVVPMFLLTPAFPPWLSRLLAPSLFLLLAAWSGAEAAGWAGAPWLAVLLAAACALFIGICLWLQLRSKRARLDATQYFWRLGLACGLIAVACWGAGLLWPALADWAPHALLLGVLLLLGGFMSVITGMLYKIVPFLIWLHLQNAGQGQVLAPNMKKILAERVMARQFWAHLASLLLLLGAVLWPAVLVWPAGLALLLSSLLLLQNLLLCLGVYRRHLSLIEERLAAAA